ncbi:hypothetical protein ABT301_27030 [Streptomyces sp. NPDC000987]|uniref:hypothetical protein n=1 Tax=Streptomyces sp. NPDC000987 TaxID=3154374 RepID=UPI003332AE62
MAATARADDHFQTDVGAEFSLQAVIVVYINGRPVEEVLPTAVHWDFEGASQYLNTYHPTVQAGTPDFDVDLQANPVRLHYWLPEVGGDRSIVVIHCQAQAPDGTWLQKDGTLDLWANGYGVRDAEGGSIRLSDLPNGNTLLSYSDCHGPDTPGIAIAYQVDGARYPGWLGAIQLVRGIRQFVGQSGKRYPLLRTDDFLLDAAAGDPDFVYGKVEVEEGEIAEYGFNDTPNQELLPVIDDDPIQRFEVDEEFRLFFVYNGSTMANPSADPTQIWAPTTVYFDWGWSATVVHNGENQWTITDSHITPPTAGQFGLPSWDGTARAAAEPDILRRQPQHTAKRLVVPVEALAPDPPPEPPQPW